MKQKLLTAICGILLFVFANAQVPQGINYQAVARNSSGAVLANQLINVRYTVHNNTTGGTTVFQERDTAITNAFGLFSHVIGTGTAVVSMLGSVDWTNGNKFLQVEFDPAGGTTFTDMGTTQLVSVPYALSAGSSADNKWAAADTNIYNLNTGFVGIGTAAPAAKLHLSSAGYTGIKLDNTFDNVKFEIGTPNPSNGSTGGLGTVSAHNLVFFANNIDRVIIDTNGKVGIGTASPAYIVDINGINGPRLRVFSQDGRYAGILAKNNTHEYFMGVQADYEAAGGTNSGFHIYDNTVGARRMVIDANGNMGVNNSTPVARLDIGGNIKIADGTQGAGKVLTSDVSGLASWKTGAGYGFRAGNTANQTIPSTFTNVNFDQEVFDDGGNYNPATGYYTAPEDGVYHFNAVFALSPGTSSGPVYGYIDVNANHAQGCGLEIAANDFFVASLSVDVKLNAGDLVNVTSFSFSNGTTIYQGAGVSNFSGHKVY